MEKKIHINKKDIPVVSKKDGKLVGSQNAIINSDAQPSSNLLPIAIFLSINEAEIKQFLKLNPEIKEVKTKFQFPDYIRYKNDGTESWDHPTLLIRERGSLREYSFTFVKLREQTIESHADGHYTITYRIDEFKEFYFYN